MAKPHQGAVDSTIAPAIDKKAGMKQKNSKSQAQTENVKPRTNTFMIVQYVFK